MAKKVENVWQSWECDSKSTILYNLVWFVRKIKECLLYKWVFIKVENV